MYPSVEWSDELDILADQIWADVTVPDPPTDSAELIEAPSAPVSEQRAFAAFWEALAIPTDARSWHTEIVRGADGRIITNIGMGGDKVLVYEHDKMRTTADVEAFARQHAPHIDWRLQGIDVEVLHSIVPHLLALGAQYPGAFRQLHSVRAANLGPLVFAQAIRTRGASDLELNLAAFRDATILRLNVRALVESGHTADTHPSADIVRTITHEFGHVVHWYLQQNTEQLRPGLTVQQAEQRWQQAAMSHIDGRLGGYPLSFPADSMLRYREAFAEGFAAIHHGTDTAQQNPFVQEQQQFLDAVFSRERGQP